MDPAGGIWTSKLGKNRVFLNFCLCAKFNRFFIILGGARFAQRKIHIFVKNRGFSVILLKFDNFGKNWVISVILIKSYNFNRNTIISNKLDSLGKENSVFLNFCVGAKFNRFFIILGGGGVGKRVKNHGFRWFLGSHILGFWGKNHENPWYIIIIFRWFFGSGYTGDRTPYTGILTKNRVFWVKLANFGENRCFLKIFC